MDSLSILRRGGPKQPTKHSPFVLIQPRFNCYEARRLNVSFILIQRIDRYTYSINV